MKLYFLPVLLLAISVPLRGQNIQGTYNQTYLNELVEMNSGNSNTVARIFDLRYEGMRGNPFLLSDWRPAELTLFGGKTLRNVPLKYDLLGKQLIWKRPTGDSVVLDSRPVQQFTFTPEGTQPSRIFRKLPKDGSALVSPTDDFFEVLCEGKTSLLAKRDKEVVEAQYKGAFSPDRRYDELLDRNLYFLQRPDGSLTKIKLSKKSVLGALSDHRSELEQYLGQSGAANDLSREAAVIQLLQYYNAL